MSVKKIIQISDIHIRKYDRHEEYIEAFNSLRESVLDNISGYSKDEVRIAVCGDIVHQKNNISPELDIMLSGFYRMLNDICKTIVIAGNHDYLVNNSDRMDSISHIMKIGNYSNVHFADMMLNYDSGLIEDDNICWAIYSSFSNFEKPKGIEKYRETSENKIIGLFHGSIIGSRTDMGKVMDIGVNADLFKECDAVMAGHIHKYQTIRKNGVPIVYGGSLIQQDFGENVSGHGYVLWDMETMKYDHIDIESHNPMYVIEIAGIDDLDNDTERFLNI